MHNITPLTGRYNLELKPSSDSLPPRLHRLGDVKLLIFFDMSTKILLFSRPLIAHTAHDVERIFSLIEQYGFDFAINNEFAEIVEQLTYRKIEPQKIYEFETGEQPQKSVMSLKNGIMD